MAGIVLEIDPTSEDAANANLVITDGTTYFLMDGYNDDPNPWDVMRASSADTEGEFVVQNRSTNRTVKVPLRIVGASASALETTLYGLQQKVGKLCREGGTLKKTTPSGDTVVFDVQGATITGISSKRYVKGGPAEIELNFECKPYARGAAVTLSDHVETTLPYIVFTETSLAGDVPGLGKLVIDNDDATNDQRLLVWGIQSRYYDAAATAALFYEAEGRTAQGGSAAAVGPSGASGGGSNVMRSGSLRLDYQSILSTQATGGGAHLSHVGTFRVFARVQLSTSNAGTVSVGLLWGEGDLRRINANPIITPDPFWEGSWRLLDLGQVTLTKAVQGTQQWEGRIIAASTVTGDTIDIDYLLLVPVDEGSGQATATVPYQQPTAFSAVDDFAVGTTPMVGRVAQVGGTWAGAGDADDFNASGGSGSPYQTRTAVSDTAGTGRYEVLGATNYAATFTQCDVGWSSLPSGSPAGTIAAVGVLARYIDTNNFLHATIRANPAGQPIIQINKKVTGTVTTIAQATKMLAAATFYRMRLQVDAAGRFALWIFDATQGAGDPILTGQDAALATGGALASGKPGIYDENQTNVAATRDFYRFFVAAPGTDAAVFASQSLELRPDRVIREDSAGTIWQPPSSYEGDYLTIPPAGKENRTLRVLVKLSRGESEQMPDGGIDDLSARLTYTPRYLVVPS